MKKAAAVTHRGRTCPCRALRVNRASALRPPARRNERSRVLSRSPPAAYCSNCTPAHANSRRPRAPPRPGDRIRDICTSRIAAHLPWPSLYLQRRRLRSGYPTERDACQKARHTRPDARLPCRTVYPRGWNVNGHDPRGVSGAAPQVAAGPAFRRVPLKRPGNVRRQVDAARGVPPLVVVPRHHLHHPVLDDERGKQIDD